MGGFDGQTVFDTTYTLELAGNAFLPQITNFKIELPEEDEFFDDEGAGL